MDNLSKDSNPGFALVETETVVFARKIKIFVGDAALIVIYSV